ncbi:SymE family type I addiction module toxin [Erwinia sp. HR93]|nr:SymE family type I addiction module toxin [Erwinia sp. HR93]MEA1063086.1 SymE family type I addiction module toxin [Erwinia sp. HR93]
MTVSILLQFLSATSGPSSFPCSAGCVLACTACSAPVSSRFFPASAVDPITAPSSCVCPPTFTSNPPLPPLNLKGNWLEEAGFASNTPVTVTVDTGNW